MDLTLRATFLVACLLFFTALAFFTLLPFAQVDAITLLIPLAERSGINLHDAALDQGLGTHQLVVRSVVYYINHLGAARANLATPRESAGLQTDGAGLPVTTSTTNDVDTLGAKLGHGSRAAHLILALLDVNIAATTGEAALVA